MYINKISAFKREAVISSALWFYHSCCKTKVSIEIRSDLVEICWIKTTKPVLLTMWFTARCLSLDYYRVAVSINIDSKHLEIFEAI